MRMLVLVGILCLLPQAAHAIVPPDLVVSVGAQIVSMFSLIVVVVAGAVAGLLTFFIGWYRIIIARLPLIAIVLLAIVLVVSNAYYVITLKETSEYHHKIVSQLQERSRALETKLINALNARVSIDNPEESFISTPIEANCTTCEFYSDTINLFGTYKDEPFVLQLDINRRQETDNVFMHYYFLNGHINGQVIDQYTQKFQSGHELASANFLPEINKVEANDASTKDSYSGAFLLQGRRLEFSITDLIGDFLTRSQVHNIRFQSVGTADITYEGETFTVQALVENLVSDDYRQSIFFPGRESVDATTHQFMLWDEENNFYMIDNSVVRSDTPAYPSHSWLLFKDAATGITQKSFTTTIDDLDVNWEITAPEFSNTVITLENEKIFKAHQRGRTRHLVSGVIEDERGIREISGILHKID